MRTIIKYIESALFGPDIEYRFQNGSKVPNNVLYV